MANMTNQVSYFSFVTITDIAILSKTALVVDPVLVSTSGDMLAGPTTLSGYRYRPYEWKINSLHESSVVLMDQLC